MLNLNVPRVRLAALHLTLVAIVLLPLVQPWKTIDPALEATASASVSSTASMNPPKVAQDSIGATSQPDPSLAAAAIALPA